MRKHRRLLFCAAVIAVLAGVMLHPAVYWPLVGRLRGEPFWRGRPDSYYAARIRARYALGPDGSLHTRPEIGAEAWARAHLPGRLAVAIWGDANPRPEDSVWWGKDDVGPEALPMLRALARRPDAAVSGRAVAAMVPLGPQAAPAVPELVAVLDSADPDARCSAALLLGQAGPVAGPAVPRLRGLAEDPAEYPSIRSYARRALQRIGLWTGLP
jgi:hypothetical protein